jgi:hypothetical protein
MKQILFISILMFCGKLFGQSPSITIFAKGDNLGTYYPLDSIQKIKLHNLKGDHTLSSDKIKLLIPLLQNFFLTEIMQKQSLDTCGELYFF